ncbi:hypothetical protein BS47DRAFT_1365460 [Hydnum rufescens UP504]|uniref:Uncharacterized protein n=1 Tax=Hydnum rufescens UP504 TaxID=1448309 RepID=A0A9P6DPL2_9AGAM|nr:hypothetical protein BS47DRAFT_1365460 [Hydnum rufescens UP504]
MDPTLSPLIVRAEVGTQTLAVSNYVKSLSLLQVQAPSAELVSGSDLNGNGGFRTSRRRGRIGSLTVNLDSAGFGVLLIHKQMVELARISLTAFSLEYAHSNTAQTINVSLSTLWILNRLGLMMLCALQFSTKPLNRIETGQGKFMGGRNTGGSAGSYTPTLRPVFTIWFFTALIPDPGVIPVVVNSLTKALGNVNEAQSQLNALGIKDARMSTPVFLDKDPFHYRQEVLQQLYRILGSVDFLGKPPRIAGSNFSFGIASVFYKPEKGAVMHGPKELGIGIGGALPQIQLQQE